MIVRGSFGVALALAATVTSLAAPSRASSQAFEGAITMRATGQTRDGQSLPELEYLVRGDRMRVNVRSPMGSMGLIAIPAEKKVFMLMDAQRAYAEMPMDAGRAAAATKATVTRTGKKETIAGRECEHIVVAEPNQAPVHVCMTKGLGTFFSAGVGQSLAPWQRELAAEGAFPLKVSGADGRTMLEVTKIEPKRLSPALFDVPDAYTKMDLPRRPPGER